MHGSVTTLKTQVFDCSKVKIPELKALNVKAMLHNGTEWHYTAVEYLFSSVLIL